MVRDFNKIVRTPWAYLLAVTLGIASGVPALASRSSENFAEKTVVITGAASGFGRGVSERLAQQGANLVLGDINSVGLEQLKQSCGKNAVTLKTDVTNYSDVENLAKAAISRFGHIDVWINDAGIGSLGRFTDLPAQDQAKVIETNVNGVIYGSHCAIRQFKTQHQGTLINVSSIVGKIPVAYYATYSASKMAVSGLDTALRQELKADKLTDIHICTVYPMPTDTPFWEHLVNYSGHTSQPPFLHKPDQVVAAIVGLIDHPKNEVVVSASGKFAVLLHNRHPKLVESVSAKSLNKQQINSDAPKVPPSEGLLAQPDSGNDGVSGGVAERMRSEKRARTKSDNEGKN